MRDETHKYCGNCGKDLGEKPKDCNEYDKFFCGKECEWLYTSEYACVPNRCG